MIDLLFLAGFAIGGAYVAMWIDVTHLWYARFKRKEQERKLRLLRTLAASSHPNFTTTKDNDRQED